MNLGFFPPLNAALNAASATLIVIAYMLIKRGHVRSHAWTMIAALATSTAFLACYLTYHELRRRAGITITRFPVSPWRGVYLGILLSHTVLAVVILPLVSSMVVLAYRRRWTAHRRLGRPTFWLWLYVSITGVIIYWMLYHLATTISAAEG